jgi:HD-like signal output (HDOD) protein
MNEHSRQSIELQINRLKNLPALPEASVKILEAINNPNISIDKLADVLSLSPGLLARLLGLANSAYFGKSREITDIRTAIIQVLGLDLVKSLALGVVVNVQFDTGKCMNFNTTYFWKRSLAAALVGQRLAVQGDFQAYSPATVYNCGLLLNIGMLVASYLFPVELNAIFFRCQQPDQVKISNEVANRLGLSHYQLGYQLLRKWQLSQIYQSVLQFFETPGQAGDELYLITLLQVSQQISSALVDGRTIDVESIERLAGISQVSAATIADIINELLDKEHSLQQMAQIMVG